MQMTIEEASNKINIMQRIVREIEDGELTWQLRADQIAEFLNEYIYILSNVKVKI